jgi:hypothetical protein
MTLPLPYFDTYCQNTTAINALRVSVGAVDVYFSYRTPVAYSLDGAPPTVRRNEWGPTTGKHLNAIDDGDKRSRVDVDTFQAGLRAALNGGA